MQWVLCCPLFPMKNDISLEILLVKAVIIILLHCIKSYLRVDPLTMSLRGNLPKREHIHYRRRCSDPISWADVHLNYRPLSTLSPRWGRATGYWRDATSFITSFCTMWRIKGKCTPLETEEKYAAKTLEMNEC